MEKGFGSTIFSFPGQTDKYTGKVREVYSFGEHIAMVATDRISAFDVVLPRAIPFKGQVLNQIAGHFLNSTKDIVPNWVLSIPDPNVTYGLKCEPFQVEMVIRGYLAGHAWRLYESGERQICGVQLPDGMRENDRFPEPIITPTTKAQKGHDEDISREEILAQGIVSEDLYHTLEKYTRTLFKRGTDQAQEKGLILVDTKYEFGLLDNTVYLIDEIHTPDSSRYFYEESYQKLLDANQPQRQLSKEFVREWLMERGFQGKTGQDIPPMDDVFVNSVSTRYIELFEKITGNEFIKAPQENITERIERNILKAIEPN